MATVSTDITETKVLTVRDRVSAFVELTKPRIAVLLVLTSAAGFYLATSGPFNYALFANSMIAIALLAFGVATLNQYWERDLDKLMDRKVSANEALIFGLAQCTIAELYLLLFVNPLTAFLGSLVIVGYVLVYTPLKTRTSVSTAIGAIPGALPPLMGWTAAADNITLTAWALFAMQFLWQFPHFLAIAWMYRKEYEKAGILMLPVVEPSGRLTARQIVMFTVMLVPVSVAPFFFGVSGVVFLIGASIIGILFLISSIQAARSKSDAMARRLLLASVIYLPVLFVLMVADKR